MYEEVEWYNAWVPPRPSSALPLQTKQRPPPAPPTRSPLAKQQDQEHQADTAPANSARRDVEEAPAVHGPPSPTLTRRARSYTDFYHVVRTQLKKEQRAKKRERENRKAIQAEIDFEQFYGGLSDELLKASHEKYTQYRDRIRLSKRHLESLSRDTSANLELLSSVSASFRAIEVQSSSFQARCEGLLAEQNRLSGIADNIAHGLVYYNLLDPITRRLNAPGAGHFVRGQDFSQMLSNLDQCLEYMQSHPQHSEASAYQARYRLLLTRALTLIRVHFTNTVRETAADVSKRLADRQLNDTTASALLYAKFRVGSAELKRLGLEIQKRAVPPPNAEPGAESEYQSLMNELYQSYSAARGRLIVPLVRKKMADLAASPSSSKDLVSFARSSISYMRGICLDEYDLWFEWLDSDGGLYEFLEAMCEPLHDYLRPRTIRETQLPKLCEMCNLIQARYMDDQEEEDSESEEAKQLDVQQLDFSTLIKPALEDAQTRLVFVAQSVLRDEIERFKPKPADIEFAGRSRQRSLSGKKGKGPALSGRKASISSPQTPVPKTPVIIEEDGTDALDLQWRYDTSSTYEEWYPTLRKAIWLLSRIYRLINSSVFDDIAHEVVHQTTLSLLKAGGQVASKSSTTDSQLFLLKQLLILKQQIVAFDIEYVTPEINFDFSNVLNTFWELRERGGLFNPANLLRLMGSGLMPRVVENMLDAKAELDGRLRTVINDFTSDWAAKITSPVSESASNKRGFDAAAAGQALRTSVEKEAGLLRAKLDEYIDDVRIKETLVGAVQEAVVQNYDDFFQRYTAKAQANGSSVPKKGGKGKTGEVWDSDAFADYTASVFTSEGYGVEPESPE